MGSIGQNDLQNITNVLLPDATAIRQGERLQRLLWVAYGVIAPAIIAIGLVGNIANLLVLTRPNLKSVTYVYLMWLAIVDLLCQLLVLPSMLNLAGVGMASSNRFAAIYHAHFDLAIINGLMAASVFIVVALTIDRYVSISRPTKFRRIHTYRRARMNISFACCAALVLNAPMCMSKKVTTKRRPSGHIYFETRHNKHVVDSTAWKIYLWTKEIATRIGPAFLLAILNAIIIHRFLQLAQKRRERRTAKQIAYLPSSTTCSSSQNEAHHHSVPPTSTAPMLLEAAASSSKTLGGGTFSEERRVVMLLGGIVVIFFVAMTPAALVSVFSSDEKFEDYEFQVFRAFANDMEILNYALNFYVYCLCSSEIRQTFVRILCCHERVTTRGQCTRCDPSPNDPLVEEPMVNGAANIVQ